jgi:hypothetical protein
MCKVWNCSRTKPRDAIHIGKDWGYFDNMTSLMKTAYNGNRESVKQAVETFFKKNMR